MQRIDREVVRTGGSGIVLVVDGDRRLLGLLTDGDIRRALMQGATLATSVSDVMVRSPVVASPDARPHALLRLFERGVRHVPIVDDQGRLADLVLYSEFSALPSEGRTLYRAKAPVRVSFAGGGTDLTPFFQDGETTVISATIDRYAQAMLRRRDDRRIVLHSFDYDDEVELESLDQIRYDGRLDLLKAAVRVMRPPFGFELYTQSDVRPGTGLGGSSALAVAVIGLLHHLCQGHVDEYRVADLAYQAERLEMGNMGGWQDQYAAAFGGFNVLEFRPGDILVHPLRLSERVVHELESNLLLCYTGSTRDSGVVHEARSRSADADRAPRREEAARLVSETREALLTGDLIRFGALLDTIWERKRGADAGVSTPEIDRLYALAKDNGAVGGKLLGAGNGGYLLLYCDPFKRHRVRDALEAEGAAPSAFRFEQRGVRIWRSGGGARSVATFPTNTEREIP